MSNILDSVKKQASKNTIYHVLFGYFFKGIPIKNLTQIYNKGRTTISRWIKNYEETGDVARKKLSMAVYRKFDVDQRNWLVNLFKERPILHQSEEAEDILRIANELLSFPWTLENLVFLDEVGFDNKDMMRKRGYALKGQKLIYRSEFVRKPRISLLCFIGVHGMLNCYQTEGTFTRLKFVDFCRRFAIDYDSKVQQYPERYSVWVMDGAKIHLNKNLIVYLRSLGIPSSILSVL